MEKIKRRSAIFSFAILVTCYGSAGSASQTYELVTEWGSYGSEKGEFIEAQGIAVGPDGNIYVADTQWNCRIQKFTPDGEFITSWGRYGSEDGEFISPWGIDFDSEGNVYVADMINDRIQKFTPEGEFVFKWSTRLAASWTYSTPFALAVDGEGNVYVQHSSATLAGSYYNCIQKFTSEGLLLREWPFLWMKANQMAVDTTGTLYLPAAILGPVQKFNGEGKLLDQWNTCSRKETFCMNSGIAIDDAGNVYISDAAHHSIKKFTAGGQLITSWDLAGPGGFSSPPSPRGLAVNGEGSVYVIDAANSRIQKYSPGSSTTTSLHHPCPLELLYGEHSRRTEGLRYLRDTVLGESREGRELVRLYYRLSGSIAAAMEQDESFRQWVRSLADGVLAWKRTAAVQDPTSLP